MWGSPGTARVGVTEKLFLKILPSHDPAAPAPLYQCCRGEEGGPTMAGPWVPLSDIIAPQIHNHWQALSNTALGSLDLSVLKVSTPECPQLMEQRRAVDLGD